VLHRSVQLRCEILEVLGSAGEEKRRTTGPNGTGEVCGDQLVAGGVIDKPTSAA
jgi:hypothetical protein